MIFRPNPNLDEDICVFDACLLLPTCLQYYCLPYNYCNCKPELPRFPVMSAAALTKCTWFSGLKPDLTRHRTTLTLPVHD